MIMVKTSCTFEKPFCQFEFLKKFVLYIFLYNIGILFQPSLLLGQHYGLKTGIIMSNVTGQSSGIFAPGLQVGAYTKLGGEEALTFRIELLLTQKGSNNYNKNNLRHINLTYIDLPLLFNLEVVDKISFNFGFAPSMMLFGSFRYSVGDNTTRRSLRREINVFDLNTMVGLEYLWTDKISFGLRYNHSFIPIAGYESEFYRNNTLPFNRVIQFYCGYRLQ